MTTLGPDSRALVTAARRAATGQDEAMTPADKARIRRKLARQIGLGLASSTAVATTATVAKAAPASWYAGAVTLLPGATKLACAVALSMAVGATVVDVTERVTEPDVPRSPPAHVITTTHAGARPEAAVLPAPPGELAGPDARLNAEPRSDSEPPTARSPRPSAQVRDPAVTDVESPPLKAVVDDALIRQVSVIREARAAIRGGDPAAALRALDTLSSLGGGTLEQEALLVRVTALCLEGDRAAARRVADELLARFPGSPHVPQLRTTCAFSPEPAP